MTYLLTAGQKIQFWIVLLSSILSIFLFNGTAVSGENSLIKGGAFPERSDYFNFDRSKYYFSMNYRDVNNERERCFSGEYSNWDKVFHGHGSEAGGMKVAKRSDFLQMTLEKQSEVKNCYDLVQTIYFFNIIWKSWRSERYSFSDSGDWNDNYKWSTSKSVWTEASSRCRYHSVLKEYGKDCSSIPDWRSPKMIEADEKDWRLRQTSKKQ